MAIQAQLFSENFGFGMVGGGGGVSQDYLENGFGLNDQQQLCLQQKQQQQQQQYMQLQQQQQLQLLQQRNQTQNLCLDQSALLSQSVLAQMERQRQEIDQFITAQNERLRLALLAQRKQQVATLLKKYESRAEVLLRAKDEEIAKAVNKRLELENLIRGMEMESQSWQRVAKENEAMVMSLNNTIEQLKESAVCLSSNGAAEDAESCCNMGGGGIQNNEEEQRRGDMVCRSCNSWNSCVIFLPCRHLCSCKACQDFLDSCPVCGMVKKSSIEALF